jgi:hypothetical protein
LCLGCSAHEAGARNYIIFRHSEENALRVFLMRRMPGRLRGFVANFTQSRSRCSEEFLGFKIFVGNSDLGTGEKFFVLLVNRRENSLVRPGIFNVLRRR